MESLGLLDEWTRCELTARDNFMGNKRKKKDDSKEILTRTQCPADIKHCEFGVNPIGRVTWYSAAQKYRKWKVILTQD